MIQHLRLGLLSLILALWGGCGFAQNTDMIIMAVVNDEIITRHDLETELSFVLLTSQLPDQPETRARLRGNILRQLIDQRLKLQAIAKAGLLLSDRDLQARVAALENSNNLRPGEMRTILRARNVSLTNLHNSINADAGWRRLITERFRRDQFIGEDEIDERIAFLIAQRAKPQHRIAEIYLPVKDISERSQTEALGNQLMQNLRNGAQFSALAQGFSQSSSASTGGDLGWISAETLPKPLDEIVANAVAGEIVGPIPVPGGFTILLVIAIQPPTDANEYTVHDLVRAIRKDADDAQWAQVKTGLAQYCDTPAPETWMRASLRKIAGAALRDFSAQIQNLLQSTQGNATSQEAVIGGNAIVFHICARTQTPPPAPHRNAVLVQLEGERISNLGRRTLNDLQNDAYIDIRVPLNS
ncbi:MAG: peptidylprolyl isomerase [Pseudomonadota bacterium]